MEKQRGHFSFANGEDRVYNNKQVIVSLFVENLPETLHWKGLWFSFARHGDVVNVYIARKRSRGGKRFGFVRMKNQEEAERVIQRLHGFTLYGSKLSVKRARNNYGWERMAAGRTHFANKRTMKPGEDLSKGHDEDGAASGSSASSIHDRLAKWGLGEINVQRLGAKTFLLTIEDEQLYLMLEDVNWSYLNEIFQEVTPWSEKVSYSERATWLEIRGLPLHCWNCVTLKKIAALWGSFEALGENDKHTMDCEKVRVLIATNQVSRIEEIIDVEVGDSVFQVSVREVGFHDGTSYPLCNNGNNEMADSEKTDESTSTSKPDTVRRKTEDEVDRSRSGTEEEIQARWVERNCINENSRDKESSRGHIKLMELVGGVPKVPGALDGVGSGAGNSRGVEEPAASIEGNAVPHAGSVNVNLVGDLDIGLNFGCGLEARPCRNLSPLSGLASNGVEKVVGSNSAVKLDPKAHASGDANRQYKSWDEQINEKVSVGYSNARDTIEEENSEDEPVKVALEIFNKAGWASKSALLFELDNKLLIKWFVNTVRRSWGIARNLAEIDSLVCDYLSVRFQFAEGLVDS
ncbi:hypothetical protein V6N13_032676 [Hibiscus sabdariffa]